jgi:hypothetical protein
MTVLVSDIAGGIGGVLLAAPAVKDQWLRLRAARQQQLKNDGVWPGLNDLMSKAWEHRRNEFDGIDSLSTLVGSLMIVAAFGLKLFDR